MEAVMLSRIQFAVTIFYHFLFVPLTIGLVIICAVIETKFARTRNPLYERMGDFWGKLFTINLVLGIVTGIAMEFQFGTNWSEYSKYMGDIFGSPLAIEALVAFFLESTFIGVWIFGRKRFSPVMRAVSMWCVAIGTNLSALWIITANGFMQNPVGYKLAEDGSKLLMEDFGAVVTNPYAWFIFFHTVIACYLVGSFFVMGISAWHIRRKSNVELFKKSFKYGLVMALFAATVTPLIGHKFGEYTAKMQPAKAAAMEAIWETGTQDFPLVKFTNAEGESTVEMFNIPKLGSYMYTGDFNGTVTGLNDIPEDMRPPVGLVFYSFRGMVTIGVILMFLSWYGLYLYRSKKLFKKNWYTKVLPFAIILPYLAINMGWIVTEVGRQPWAVYGLMLTEDAASPLAPAQIIFSLGSLVVFYTILLIANVYLMIKYARKGPEEAASGGVKHVA